jgi:integrase
VVCATLCQSNAPRRRPAPRPRQGDIGEVELAGDQADGGIVLEGGQAGPDGSFALQDGVDRKALAGSGEPDTPHSLRHTMVTLALDAGVSLRDVQDAARHADPRTTPPLRPRAPCA